MCISRKIMKYSIRVRCGNNGKSNLWIYAVLIENWNAFIVLHAFNFLNIFFITAQLPFSTRVACNENEMVVDVLSSSSHLITEAYLQGLKNYPGKPNECWIIIMLPATNAGRLTWSPSKSSNVERAYISCRFDTNVPITFQHFLKEFAITQKWNAFKQTIL